MKIKVLLVLPILLLSGCDNEQNKIYLERNALLENNLVTSEDDITLFTKSADNDLLIKLSETKQDYVVYTYSENCSFCTSFLPILKDYLLDTHHLIYSYNASSNDLNALNSYLPDVYSVLGTPNMSFFKDGKKISELASSRFQNAHNFKIAFESYITSSYILEIYDFNSAFKALGTNNSIFYFYEDDTSYTFYKEHFYLDFNKLTTIDAYRIDLSRLNEEQINILEDNFAINLSSGSIYLNTLNEKDFIAHDDINFIERYEEIVSSLSND